MHPSDNPTTPLISLPRNEIHLWLIDEQAVEAANVLRDYHAVISADENQRLSAINSSKRKQQFLITRVALRYILSFYLVDLLPLDIRFTVNKFGKPALEEDFNHLQFNVSHTDGKVLIGVANKRALGVDIEYMNKSRNILKIAEHYFHSKEWNVSLMQHNSISDHEQVRRFYKLWTLKEAFIKAEGRGFFLATDLFYFEDCHSHKPKLVFTSLGLYSTKSWQFEHAFLASNYSLSVAFEHTVPEPVAEVIARQYIPLRSFSPINLG
jgi:4'-phosphopantetheinyl transferase